jgi:hypothetical protein
LVSAQAVGRLGAMVGSRNVSTLESDVSGFRAYKEGPLLNRTGRALIATVNGERIVMTLIETES